MSAASDEGLPVPVEIDGQVRRWPSISAAAREIGISRTVVLTRTSRYGWPLDRALTTPVRPVTPPRPITIDGVDYPSVAAAARATGQSQSALNRRARTRLDQLRRGDL